jgi:succinate dehydrogenase / fumarate reductase cytochrome b subunit
MQATDGRPIYLNLFKIKLPITGLISISHRITGVLLFLAIPIAAYLFERSLSDEAGFEAAVAVLSSPWLLPVYLIIVWSMAHHLIAGLRYLLIDVHIGVDKQSATRSAWITLIAGVAAAILFLLGAAL